MHLHLETGLMFGCSTLEEKNQQQTNEFYKLSQFNN